MRHATPVASSVGVTIAGGRAQFHVDFGEANFPTRKIFMALVTFKANVVVVVQVHSKIVTHEESDSTEFTSTFIIGIREKNDEGMVCEEETCSFVSLVISVTCLQYIHSHLMA